MVFESLLLLDCILYLVCPLSSVGEREREREREREALIHICLPGIGCGGLEREWAGEKGGGGYSLSAKQEVAQHLFLGIQRGSEWPAVC